MQVVCGVWFVGCSGIDLITIARLPGLVTRRLRSRQAGMCVQGFPRKTFQGLLLPGGGQIGQKQVT